MAAKKDAEQRDSEATVVMQDSPDQAPGANDRADPQVELERALSAAETRAEEHRNDYLRALAELENVRRRSQRDVENAHRYGLERFAQELLPVKDGLELGVQAGEKAGDHADLKALMEGKEATLKLLVRAFEKFNIKEINPLGEPFDPQFHEAMVMQPSGTAEPNSVLQVIQTGYRLNDRLLRPARVIVAQAPSDA